MSSSEVRTLTSKQVRSSLMRCFAVKRPAFIWGPPGIGKSELVEQIAKDLDGVMFDLRLGQMEPTDIRGIPFYNKDSGTMDWAQPVDLPNGEATIADAAPILAAISDHVDSLEQTTKLEDLPIVILFLDEMNSAPPSVLAAAYQLILNRRIGKYKLPDNVVVVAAGNRESDKGVTFRMPTPLSNRFVHFEMKVDFESWLDWAVQNNISQDVIGYIGFSKGDLSDFSSKSSSRAFATPRSWTFVSDLISDPTLDRDTLMNLVAGTIGDGLAIKFMAHRDVAKDMPNPLDILNGKVKDLKTDSISAMYSLVISMCYELKEAADNGVNDKEFHKMADNFIQYMMDNFKPELVIMGARVALVTYNLNINPLKLTSFKPFHAKYGHYVTAAKG